MLSIRQLPELQSIIGNSLPSIKKHNTKQSQSHQPTVTPPSRNIKRRDKIGIVRNEQKTIIQVDEAITTELYQNCGVSGQQGNKMDFMKVMNRDKNTQQGNKKNNRNNNMQARIQNPELFGENEELMNQSRKMKIIFKPTEYELTSQLKPQGLSTSLLKNKLERSKEIVESPYKVKRMENTRQFQSLQLLPEKYSIHRLTDNGLTHQNKTKRRSTSIVEKLKENPKSSKCQKRQMKSASIKSTKFHSIQFSNPKPVKAKKNGSKSLDPLIKYREIGRCYMKDVKFIRVKKSNEKQDKNHQLSVSVSKKNKVIIQISDK